MRKSLSTSLLALAGAVLLLDPRRNFPLDDDWVYFIDVRHFLERGYLRIGDYPSANLVAHVAWGALFARIFGLGHGTLRLSTLCLAVLALIVFDRLDDRGPAPGPAALSPAFALLANPLFFLLSFTFMADVPYLAWSLAALALYLKAAETDRDVWWAAGSLIASWAYLLRQLGVFLPLAALIFLLLRRRLDIRRAALIALPMAVTVLAHRWWFFRVNGATWAYESYNLNGTWRHLARPVGFLRDVYERASGMLLEFSLFTLPWLVALNLKKGPRLPKPKAALLLLAAVLPALFFFGGFPYLPDLITSRGLGAAPISGAAFKAAGLLGAPWFLRGLTFLSIAGALGWLAWMDELESAVEDPAVQLLGLAAVLQIGASLLGANFYDRYLLPALPAVFLCARRAAGGDLPPLRRLWPAAALGGLFLLWSTLGTWDDLNWKGAAWDAASAAVRAGIPAESLDGGYEWCGLHVYERNMAVLKARKPLAEIGPWEWVAMQPFSARVTSDPHPLKDQRLLLSVPYRTPLSFAAQAVYVYAGGNIRE